MMILRCWLLAQDIAEKSTADVLQSCWYCFWAQAGEITPQTINLFVCLFVCVICLFVCVMAYFYFMEPIGLTPADQLMCG